MSYTFVCIGTNKIVPDSFGPRVGDKLKQVFYSSPEISVYGTMQIQYIWKMLLTF